MQKSGKLQFNILIPVRQEIFVLLNRCRLRYMKYFNKPEYPFVHESCERPRLKKL
jgi:hypothetical protein